MRQIRGRDRRIRWLRSRVVDGSTRPPRALAPLGGKPRRSPSVSCASPSTPLMMRVRVRRCHAWPRRVFDRNQRPQSARSLERAASPFGPVAFRLVHPD
eukprot:6212081-Pleurochrysis_carterae.AAC.4